MTGGHDGALVGTTKRDEDRRITTREGAAKMKGNMEVNKSISRQCFLMFCDIPYVTDRSKKTYSHT